MGKAEINKLTKDTLKALNSLENRAEVNPERTRERLLLEARASVAIEHPNSYDYSIEKGKAPIRSR